MNKHPIIQKAYNAINDRFLVAPPIVNILRLGKVRYTPSFFNFDKEELERAEFMQKHGIVEYIKKYGFKESDNN